MKEKGRFTFITPIAVVAWQTVTRKRAPVPKAPPMGTTGGRSHGLTAPIRQGAAREAVQGLCRRLKVVYLQETIHDTKIVFEKHISFLNRNSCTTSLCVPHLHFFSY